MVSYSGYWQYQNLIQADPIPQKEKCYISENSISGYLQRHPDFKLFQWMIKLADMELKMGNEQFDSTLFVVPDQYLVRQFGSEQYFIDMDMAIKYWLFFSSFFCRFFGYSFCRFFGSSFCRFFGSSFCRFS